MKIHGTAKGGALATKDFGVAFGGAPAGWADLSELKAYYKFDETSGNIINQAESVGSTDSLGTGADIVITGATYSQTGIIDKALKFIATNSDFGAFGTSLSQFNFFHGTGDWSINFWVNLTSYVNEARFFDNGNANSSITLRNGSDADTQSIKIYNGSGSIMVNDIITLDETFTTGDWKMITWTCDYSDASNCYELFIDGEPQATLPRSTAGTTSNSATSMKTMTKYDNSGNFQNGLQDETSIWKRLLTDEEITELYNDDKAFAL